MTSGATARIACDRNAQVRDFDDGNVPVPGHPLTGYLRVHPDGDGSRVVVHQLVDRTDQAEFMTGAWAMVLGRLRANVVAALAGPPPPPRSARAKESSRRSATH